MRIDNDLSYIDFKSSTDEKDEKKNITIVDKYPTKEPVEFNFFQKKSAFKAKSSLSLDRRFQSLMLNDDILTGLSFLHAFLTKENKVLWQRLRLIYDKKSVSFIENYNRNKEFSPANQRCLKRLWKFTNDTVISH